VARAAREAGVSIWEMMEYLRSKKIPSQYDFEEWERDLEETEREARLEAAEALFRVGAPVDEWAVMKRQIDDARRESHP
jgi:hypothetical protein